MIFSVMNLLCLNNTKTVKQYQYNPEERLIGISYVRVAMNKGDFRIPLNGADLFEAESYSEEILSHNIGRRTE
jgi:hypothetical protein